MLKSSAKMIGTCFGGPSPLSLHEVQSYLNECMQTVRSTCRSVSPEALAFCNHVFSPLIISSGALMTVKGLHDFHTVGWKSPRAWMEVALGVVTLFAGVIEKSPFCSVGIKILPFEIPPFCTYPTALYQKNAESAAWNRLRQMYGDSVVQSGAVVKCSLGSWDPEAQRYNQLCTVHGLQKDSLYEVECFVNKAPMGWTQRLFLAFEDEV